MLQEKLLRNYTPLGQSLSNFKDIALSFEQVPRINFHESLRIQIPRTLMVIYDIRNKRDIGHLSKEINANYTDATLSAISCNWVLAELLRIFNIFPDIDEAQRIVNDLIKIKTPLIQDFDGFPKILKTTLGWKDKVMLLLYYHAEKEISYQDLKKWLQKIKTNALNPTLGGLEHNDAFIHKNGDGLYLITNTGEEYVEKNILSK